MNLRGSSSRFFIGETNDHVGLLAECGIFHLSYFYTNMSPYGLFVIPQ